MKLVIFGLTISSSWGNGHATLWRGLCSALSRQGHRVAFFERNTPYYAMNRDVFSLPGGELVPASEAAHPHAGVFIFLIWLQTLFSILTYAPIAA